MTEPRLKDALKRHMRKNGLDSRKTAKLSGVSENTISRIMSDDNYNPSPDTLELIATKAFGLSKTSDIWLDPFQLPAQQPQHAPIDLADLENDPRLVINGKPLTEEQRQAYKSLLNILRLSRQ